MGKEQLDDRPTRSIPRDITLSLTTNENGETVLVYADAIMTITKLITREVAEDIEKRMLCVVKSAPLSVYSYEESYV